MRLGGKKGLILIVSSLLVVAIPTGWLTWKARVKENRLRDLIHQAETSAQAGRHQEVYAWVEAARPLALNQPNLLEQLDHLETRAAGHLRDFPRLLKLYDRQRPIFFNDPEAEEAALWMTRFLLGMHRMDESRKLIETWKTQGKLKPAWVSAQTDLLLVSGQKEEAAELLNSQRFDGRDDSGRLLRLAMLSVDKPEQARRYLNEAFIADSKNPDLRLFRARTLEASGEIARARVEYVAALLGAPQNPLMRHELAQFYSRQRDWENAVKTWEEPGTTTRLDVLALNAIFWRRVALGGEAPKDTRPLQGLRSEVVRALEALPPDQFPEPSLIQTWKNGEGSEELWWLSLLGLLQNGREQPALDALESSPYRARGRYVSLSQELLVVLRWRLKQVAPQSGDLSNRAGETLPPFSQTLLQWSRRRVADSVQPSKELAAVLSDNQIWSLVLASAGWNAAAVRLLPSKARAGEAPDWSAYALAQALQQMRGAQAALDYLEGRTPTTALEGVRGEAFLLAGKRAEGVDILEKVSSAGGEAGYRAAWVLANLALAEERILDVEKYVTRDTALAASVTGRELIARAAVTGGHLELADRLYQALGEASTEGMVWQSRRAFEAKQWDKAEALTVKLTEQYPDQLEFAANLKLIRDARLKP